MWLQRSESRPIRSPTDVWLLQFGQVTSVWTGSVSSAPLCRHLLTRKGQSLNEARAIFV